MSQFGYNPGGSLASTDQNVRIQWFKSPNTPAANGTVTSITVLDCQGVTGHNLAVAIYSDDGASPSHPLSLLANSTPGDGVLPASYGTVTTSISLAVTAGTQYWFAIMDGTDPAQNVGEHVDSVNANSLYYSGAADAVFPATASGGSLFAESPQIFATYTPAATDASLSFGRSGRRPAGFKPGLAR